MTAVVPEARSASDPDIDSWIAQFHRDGYLVVRDVLPPDLIEQLKQELDAALDEQPTETRSEIRQRMFEHSAANLSLFDREPIVTFAERIIGDERPGFAPGQTGRDHVHVIHNNSFRTPPGPGFAARWHTDEPPYFRVTDGKPPGNVHLPVLLFTCNYYLTDVWDTEHGPTEFVPGSHLFGAAPPETMESTEWEDRVSPALGAAGTALLFNCQTWHRGGPNTSDVTRYVAQVSYAYRTIGHRFYPFMNYVMPEHVYADASPRLKRLLGWVPKGPYG